MIARQKSVEAEPNSLQSLFATTAEAKDYLADLMPFPKGSTSGKSTLVRQRIKHE
jgi:hypothetical protein